MRRWQATTLAIGVGLAASGLVISAATTAVGAGGIRSNQRGPRVSAPAVSVLVTDQTSTVDLEATDPDGDPIVWSAVALPPTATFDVRTGTLSWTPTAIDIGQRTVYVAARDPGGRSAVTHVRLVVRAPAHPSEYLALGDSVPAGHGLDWYDYERTDPCWRAENDSYPGKLFERWSTQRAGAVPGAGTYQLLACSGATVVDMLAPGGQVDQTLARNPGLVTITIGANDLGFTHPERLLPGGRLDQSTVDARLAALRNNLIRAISRIVDGTDAKVLLTTYHDPTADDPVGVPGCRGACFREASRAVVADLNAVITSVAHGFPTSRVGLVDVAARFVGHGAPNGWGVDAWREGGLPGWVPEWMLPEGTDWAMDAANSVQPYCASGHNLGDDPNWVSGVDCVHPNEDGARAYADAIWETWQATGWR